jgi:hypothetical protein
MRNKVRECLRARDDVADKVHVRVRELHDWGPRMNVVKSCKNYMYCTEILSCKSSGLIDSRIFDYVIDSLNSEESEKMEAYLLEIHVVHIKPCIYR